MVTPKKVVAPKEVVLKELLLKLNFKELLNRRQSVSPSVIVPLVTPLKRPLLPL